MIYNYVSKSSPISPLPFRREKEHTSFRIINVSFFQSPGKGSTTALQRFADGECPRPRFVPLPSRLALSPSPLRKKERKAASFSYRAAFLPFFVGGLATFTIIPYEYIHAHTHIFILTHARRSNVSLYRKEARLFCDFTESTEEEAAEEKGRFDLYPRGLPPFQTDLFPSRLRERAEMQRILFLTIQTASRPRRPT